MSRRREMREFDLREKARMFVRVTQQLAAWVPDPDKKRQGYLDHFDILLKELQEAGVLPFVRYHARNKPPMYLDGQGQRKGEGEDGMGVRDA